MMSVVGALHPRAERALMAHTPRPSAQKGRALALAAIREMYEETGILFGSRAYGPPEKIPNAGWEAFRELGVLPDLEALQLVARAITPSKRTRRFDTRFFAVDRRAIGHVNEGTVGPQSELVELAWVTFTQARALDLAEHHPRSFSPIWKIASPTVSRRSFRCRFITTVVAARSATCSRVRSALARRRRVAGDQRREKTREALVEVGPPEADQALRSFGADINESGLPQLRQMVAQARLGAEMKELAAGHFALIALRQGRDDGETRLVAQRRKHIGEGDLFCFRVRQGGHPPSLPIFTRWFNVY